MIAAYIYQTTVPIRITPEDAFRAGKLLGKSPLYFLHLLEHYPITTTPLPYYGA